MRLLLFVGICLISFCSLYAQPSVDFSASSTEGCGSLEVQFTDLSTPNGSPIISWDWDLGGVSGSGSNPGRIFNDAGAYTICLTVTDQTGNTAQVCKDDYIRVFALPDAQFTVSDEDGCLPFTTTFSDASSAGDAPIIEWIWGVGGDCGALVKSDSTDVTCTYHVTGAYTISLAVTDANGCISAVTAPALIDVSSTPDVAFTADATFGCDLPFVTQFTNLSQGQSAEINYTWDFGNGEVFQGAIPPQITYDNPGTYSVSLTAIDDASGCTNTLLQEDFIQIGEVANFTFDVESVCLGEPVNFYHHASSQPDSIIWDVGYNGFTFKDVDTFQFLYPDTGCYSVTLQRYFDGCEQVGTFDCVEVLPLPEIALSVSDTAFCSLPKTLDFTVTGDTDDIFFYEWNFGTGNIDSTLLPMNVYTVDEYRTYFVSVIGTSNEGCTSDLVQTTISTLPILADILGLDYQGCAPLTVQLEADVLTTSPLTDVQWIVNNGLDTYTDTNSVFSLTLSDTGKYDVTLIVANAEGCMDTITLQQYIRVGQKPQVDFVASPIPVCLKDPVFFTDLSSDYANEWYWDFQNDGSYESGFPEVQYTYDEFGTFGVRLVVGHNGCYDTLIRPDYVVVQPPQAIFDVSYNCETPFTVQFTNTSLQADRYHWDFGVSGIVSDTSNAENPTFTFPSIADYSVMLTAYNDATGCEHQFSRIVKITDPTASFTLDTTLGCVPLVLQANNLSVSASTYQWIVPGGTVQGSAPNQSLRYNSPGIFEPPALIATDIHGCSDTAYFDDSIRANRLHLSVLPTDSLRGCVPLVRELSINANATFANLPDIYYWEVPELDMADSTNGDFTLNINTAGNHSLRVFATDSWGCPADISLPITLGDPEIDFDTDSLACPGVAHAFSYTSGGDQALGYVWEFGDGNSQAGSAVASHVYVTEGLYEACLTLTDSSNDCVSQVCKFVNVRSPIADFQADTFSATCPPLLVHFENQSAFAKQYRWNFGDSSGVSLLENPLHLYALPGLYTVELIAIRSALCTDTFSIIDYIDVNGPIGSMEVDVVGNCAPLEVTLTGSSQNPYLYLWDYGDGSPLDSFDQVTEVSVLHVYNHPGQYLPSLSVIDTQQCKISIVSDKVIEVVSAAVGFSNTDSLGCEQLITTFTDTSFITTTDFHRQWFFEGGMPATSFDSVVQVVYDNPGIYDVMLIIRAGECIDTLIKEDAVRVAADPIADFTYLPNPICVPETVRFINTSQSSDGAITQLEWTNSKGIKGDGQMFTNLISANDLFSVQLIATTEFGCTDTLIQDIPLFEPNIFTIPPPPIICIGNSVVLEPKVQNSSIFLEYEWEAAATLSCTSCENPVASPTVSTWYYLTVTNPEGCSYSDSVWVEVSPFSAPDIQISPDTSICENSAIPLLATGGMDIYDYQWDSTRLGLSCYEFCNSPVATPQTTTTYVVTVTNEFNCVSKDSVTITVLPSDSNFAGSDHTICLGQRTTLSIDGSQVSDIIWSPTDDLSCGDCPSPIASPTENTLYVVSARSTENGCQWTDSVWVYVLQDGDVFAGEDTVICRNQQVLLSGSGPGVPMWSPGNSVSDPNALSTIATVAHSTLFILTMDVGSCMLRDSVWVRVIDTLSVPDLDTVICASTELMISLESPAAFYEWLPNSAFADPTSSTQSFTLTSDAMYHYIGSTPGCGSDTGTVRIKVLPLPEASLPAVIYFLPTQQEVDIPLMVPGGSGQYLYQWLPDDGLTCTNCAYTTALPVDGQRYSVTISDPVTGCAQSLTTRLSTLLQCPQDLVHFPNVFSPNDDGQNDELIFFMDPILEDQFTSLRIYDRWGENVFATKDRNDRWDGTFQDKRLGPSVYVYLLTAVCPLTGEEVIWKGSISIVR